MTMMNNNEGINNFARVTSTRGRVIHFASHLHTYGFVCQNKCKIISIKTFHWTPSREFCPLIPSSAMNLTRHVVEKDFSYGGRSCVFHVPNLHNIWCSTILRLIFWCPESSFYTLLFIFKG